MEEKVADAILEVPQYFYVKNRGITKYLGFRKLKISITPLWPGTVIKISREKKRLKFDQEDYKANPFKHAFDNFEHNSPIIAKIIAVAIINTKVEKRWLTNMLAWYLHANLTEGDRFALMMIIRSRINISDFINSIVFLDGIGILEPKKTETSPTGTGEIIAPGDSLEG